MSENLSSSEAIALDDDSENLLFACWFTRVGGLGLPQPPLRNWSKNLGKMKTPKMIFFCPQVGEGGRRLIKKFRKIVKFDKNFIYFDFQFYIKLSRCPGKFKKLNDQKWYYFGLLGWTRHSKFLGRPFFAFFFAFFYGI